MMTVTNKSTNLNSVGEKILFREIYDGKLTFCYASCLSMLLKFHNIELSVPYLENLTTCSYGFFYQRFPNYFNLFISDVSPDTGLIIAGQILGFEIIQKNFDNFIQAKNFLDMILIDTPVIIGPVNLGTMPNHKFEHIPPGADHYIVALNKYNNFEYVINDPEGFIEIPITADELDTIWEGKEIMYTNSKYILTYLGEKIRNPSRVEIFKSVLSQILKNLETKEINSNFFVGSGAIDIFITDFTNGRYNNISSIQNGFQLEMNNQRSYVSGSFLKSFEDIHPLINDCALIRFEQAKLFGRARIVSMHKADEELIKILENVSKLEKNFHKLIQTVHNEL